VAASWWLRSVSAYFTSATIVISSFASAQRSLFPADSFPFADSYLPVPREDAISDCLCHSGSGKGAAQERQRKRKAASGIPNKSPTCFVADCGSLAPFPSPSSIPYVFSEDIVNLLRFQNRNVTPCWFQSWRANPAAAIRLCCFASISPAGQCLFTHSLPGVVHVDPGSLNPTCRQFFSVNPPSIRCDLPRLSSACWRLSSPSMFSL
jgi:hypothetical protein